MTLRIIAVGKQREPGLALAAQEYQRRLGRYLKLQVVEVPDEKDPGPDAAALQEKAKAAEGERILSRLAANDRVIALCVEGEYLDTLAFSGRVAEWERQGRSPVFVIGGSLGLSASVLARADERLSLSAMTYPHQLARVVLLEQVYRACKINAGERYHK